MIDWKSVFPAATARFKNDGALYDEAARRTAQTFQNMTFKVCEGIS